MEIIIVYILIILLAISIIVQRKLICDLMRLVDFMLFLEKDNLEERKEDYINYYEN